MKRVIKWVLVAFLLVLVIVIAGLSLFGGRVIRKSVNTFGPAALGVPVTLREAQFSPLRGRLVLAGLHVANPKGFNTEALLDVEQIEVELDVRTLLSDPIVIRKILVRDPRITYEQGLRHSNLGALVEQLGGDAEQPSKPAANEKGGKKVVIDELTVTGGKVKLSVTAAMGMSAPIALATVSLKHIGREGGTEGVGPVDVVRILLVTILKSVTQAIGGIGGLTVDGLKAMGGGAVKIGEGTMDALKSAGGGKVGEGAKAVGRGATQVGGAAVEGVKQVGKALGGLMGRSDTNVPAAKD
jgi:hypothetical protein